MTHPAGESGHAASGGVTTHYTVSGMTCDHCVRAVTREIAAMVPNVHGVAVDLERGRVSIVSEAAPDDATVRAAVDEAGYELVG